jgi:hypothetical protein
MGCVEMKKKRMSMISMSTHISVLAFNVCCGVLICDYLSDGVILKGGRIMLSGVDAAVMVGVFTAFIALVDVIYIHEWSRKLGDGI